MSYSFKSVIYKTAGVRHIERNKPCEDSVFSYSSKNGVLGVSLSDGAGSYKYASTGSDIVTKVSASFMADKFERLYELDNDTIAEYVLHEVLIPIKEVASSKNEEILQFSATLLCVAVHPDGRYIIMHVGDGAIVGLNIKNETEVISVYEHDGPVNQTAFVTVPGTDVFVKKGNGGYASFVMMSDGPEDFLVNEMGANPRVRLMQQLAFFLDEDAMQRQLESLVKLLINNGMDDDASFAMICDVRELSELLLGLSPEFRKMLFSLDNDLSEAKRKRVKQVLDNISSSPNGLTLLELTRKMHVHSKSVARKKIEFLYAMGIIKQENGRIFIST